MTGQQDSIFEGKTLDDAVRKGLEALGLSRAEVMITVVEEGSSGFLGIGARPYKVRVMARPGGPPREPGERRERGERGGRRGRGGSREAGRGEGRGDRRDRGQPGRPSRESRREERGGAREAATPTMERDEHGEGGEPRRRRRRRGRRGGRGRTVGGGVPAGASLAAPVAPARAEARPAAPRGEAQARPGAPTMSPEALTDLARRATEDLLHAMGFEARVSARAEGVNVDVTAEVSEGEELLTGRKGEVRQALQHLLNLTINRGEGMRYHLQLEINEFWRRREAELQELARKMADEAAATGVEMLTEYLNAQERRIIHVTLRDDKRVKTYAIGDGLIKKLAVAPADHPEAARADD